MPWKQGLPGESRLLVKNPPASAGNSRDLSWIHLSWIPGSGRSSGKGNAAHSSILAWKVLWTEEPGRLEFMRSQSDTTECTCATRLTLCDPVDYSLPGSVHGLLHARILEWVASSFSRGSSRPWDLTWVSHIAGRRFNLCTTRDVLEQPPTTRCKQFS